MGRYFQYIGLTASSGDVHAGIGFTRHFVCSRIGGPVGKACVNGTTQGGQAAVCSGCTRIEHSRKHGNG